MMTHILLLEDSKFDAELILESLTAFQFTSTLVGTRDEYTEALGHQKFDLILSDYSLPGFSGHEALHLAQSICPDTPFIFVSGVLGEDNAINSFKDGATDYVLKEKLFRLQAAVDRALSEREEKDARKKAETELRLLAETLENRVKERTDELAEANEALRDQIAKKESVEATLGQMQRLEAVGQLTAGVAHDFNNLVTVILGNAQFLRKGAQNERDLGRIAQIVDAAQRGARLTTQLLAFARRQRLVSKSVNLNEIIDGMYDLLSSVMGGAHIKIKAICKNRAVVDQTQMELAIMNLCINARDAMKVGDTLSIETRDVAVTDTPTRPEEPEPGNYVVVAVADTGTGMSEDVRNRVFEPFFTTKPVGKGSGLGLAQIYGFAKQSSGGIRIHTQEGKGTTVEIFVPVAESTPVFDEVAPALPEKITRPDARIILIDDDHSVRATIKDMLDGLNVTDIDSAEQALTMVTADCSDLFIVDYAMPNMTGLDFAHKMRETCPKIPVLFVTGYADAVAQLGLENTRVLQKPFTQQQLLGKVGELLT